jgi:translation elongation factor EF-1alpha
MRTLKQSMIDLGMQARYKTMETEELYRATTIDRLIVIINRTRNVQRARRDFRKIVAYMAMYDQEYPMLREILVDFLPNTSITSKRLHDTLSNQMKNYKAIVCQLITSI